MVMLDRDLGNLADCLRVFQGVDEFAPLALESFAIASGGFQGTQSSMRAVRLPRGEHGAGQTPDQNECEQCHRRQLVLGLLARRT